MSAPLELLLRARVPPRMLEAPLREALASPWGYPRDEALAATARAWGYAPAAPPPPGAACGVVAAGDVGVVVRLEREGSLAPLAESQAALATALRLAREHTPWLLDPAALDDPALRAEPLYRVGAPPLAAVDGGSFGLAFFGALVSALARTPLRSDTLAAATLDAVGGAGRVEALAAKLRAVAAQALGVERVLVADGQRDEALAIAATLPRPLTIVGVETAPQALAWLFDANELERGPSPQALEPAPRWCAALHGLVRRVPQLPRWEPVARAANALYALEPRRPELAVVRAVALRHAGEASPPLAWDEALVDALGNAFVAQLVQGAGDAGDPCAAAFVERSLGLVRAAPAEPGSLMALGACGRVLAMLRRFEEAERCLREATLRWLRRDEAAHASRSLCEWLRVSSVRGDADAFEAARAQLAAVGSSLYTDLALVAGHVRLGRPDDALAVPERPASSEQAYVARSLQRWRARAWAARVDVGRAAALRRELTSASGVGGPTPEALFCALDAARERGHGVTEALAAIDARRPQGLTWLSEGCDEAERARRYADEGPY